ncbi:MAG: ferritin-like domain-containing protein [Actinomycetota bacterium]
MNGPHIHSDRAGAADVRRAARDISATAAADTRAMGTSVRALLDSTDGVHERHHALVGRRRFLQLGGFSVATASVIAACGGAEAGGVARVGVAPTTTKLPDPIVNDVVLLRTAASLEYSAIAVYDTIIGNSELLDSALRDVAKRFRDDHAGHAALFDQLTIEAGGKAWGCSNPRIDDLLVAPVLRSIVGGAADGTSAEQAPSDDPKRDVLNFAHGVETLAGSTYQGMAASLSLPALRKETLIVGSHEVRHAALLALTITGNPAGILPPAEAPADPPPIPVVYALPTRFGSLGSTQVVVGAADENGARTTFNLDTPSLNTFVYEYVTPSC